MRHDKEKALALRLKGRSYNEINQLLGIPKSTLSGWFSNVHLSDSAHRRLQKRVEEGSARGLVKHNKKQTHLARQRANKIRADAAKKIQKLGKQNLLLLGAALYWAEGYKRPIVYKGRERTYHPVSLSNSDPKLICLFIRFLKEICEVENEKILAQVRLYQHMNEEVVLKYWQDVTGIPKTQFMKHYYGVSKSSLSKRPYNRLPYGTIQIRVTNTKVFHQIMGYIEGLEKKCLA